jgi:hypothetical protein
MHKDFKSLATKLKRANARVALDFPGERGDRQPVHTVYGGAHLFRADLAPKLGALARRALDEHAPTPQALGDALDLWQHGDLPFAANIRERVAAKLQREPVEDFRIGLEDVDGHRPDDEEDGHAVSAAREMADGLAAGTLPPFVGIRIKPLSNELHARSLRTLDLFVTTLAAATKRQLPPNFAITIPKLMSPVHVEAAAGACAALERRLRLPRGVLRLELMIETPQSILAPDGT